MRFGDMYGMVVTIGLTGITVGIVIYILSALGSAGSLTGDASTAINNTVTAIAPVTSTWLPIIVIVGFAGLVIGLLIFAFGGGGKR